MNNLPLKKINEEVFLAADDIVRLDQRSVDFIRTQALENTRGRARICAHKDPMDSLHEMIIAIRADSYIRPHRHHNKIESFHLIEGRVDIIILQEDGEIEDVISLGKDQCFYYRLNSSHYHTLIIHSPMLIIHEITNGPFDVSASDFADFSPDETDPDKVTTYIRALKERALMHVNN